MRKVGDQISPHEIKVYLWFLRHSDRWFANAEVKPKGVSARCVRSHTRNLATNGVLESSTLSPNYKYKLAKKIRPSKYFTMLSEAIKTL